MGVVRVSREGGREGERFVSPVEQRQRISDECERGGLTLVDVIEEPNVSGGSPLERRPGLRRAVELVEGREADVVVVAYFDRLVRSLQVQREVVDRVEAAGGAILAVDVGEVRSDTASRWLSSTMLGMVAEYHRRVTGERTADAKRRAVARGVPPFPNVPPGLLSNEDGTLRRDPKLAPIVAEAVERRANGATIKDVREYLRRGGVNRSYHGVQALLSNRLLVGELRFGDLLNESAGPTIVARETFERAQRVKIPRGRRAKSERLLARLGVIRCATCGARMVVGTSQGTYGMYRCPPVGDCARRVTISADIIENVVSDAVIELLAGMKGTASVETGAEEAARELERCENELAAAVRAFTGLEDVDAARERLLELREARDRARDRRDELEAATAPALTVTTGDWDLLTLDERRALIRAVIDRVEVAPGRSPDRITVHPRGE